MSELTKDYLQQRQSLPLEGKIILTQQRIKQWHDYWEGNIYVSFSGGKDSTVLVDLVKDTPGVWDVPVVYCDTGLEYPEVRVMGRKLADVILTPEMPFNKVIEKYGYPAIGKEQAQYINEARNTNSEKLRDLRINGRNGRFKISNKYMYMLDAPFEVSHKCCDVMKKNPFKKYEKETGRKPIIGTMADESSLRKQQYLKNGCNAFEGKRPKSTPMGFWTEQDVLEYIKTRNLEYASVYGDIVETEKGLELTGEPRTGCMFCMFGAQYEPCPNKFQRMKTTHPKQYDYCMNKLGLDEVLNYMGVDH